MTLTPHAAMLFAAGFGTRMGQLTQDRPKPLIEVAGRPLIDHSLALAKAMTLTRIVANTHYKADMLADHLRPLGVALSHETPDILDTGGGLKAALPLLGQGPVFSINTDVIWVGPNPLARLLDHWDPDRMDALLMCVPVARSVAHAGPGDFKIDRAGRIQRGAGEIYGGVQIIKTDGLNDISQSAFSLNLLWDKLQTQGRLFALSYPGRWCDVGHPEGIALAEQTLAGSDV